MHERIRRTIADQAAKQGDASMPPTCRAQLSTLEAMPARDRSTDASVALVMVGTTKATPLAAISIGTINSAYWPPMLTRINNR